MFDERARAGEEAPAAWRAEGEDAGAGLAGGHEAHFAEVTKNFLRYLKDRSALPSWERPNMLAKYHVTTAGVALARAKQPEGSPV